ncbi:HAD-IA family hydrolase [Kitasatospora sp. NPDC089913]|uniref:HAD family hydrolase n=1 Tax=Streptomycetaceae TaxID=2062 RepID=UPI000B87C378|nr:HAD-IA family hydrolase [Streptomyces sp. TLI_053]
MPLLLLDLDNTLLPRDAAFRAWAQDFLLERALPPTDVEWLATIDGGGYVPRSTVLSAARRRYGLDESLDRLLAHYRRGINAHIHCPARNLDALRAARAAGWTLGIVSNGNTGAQLEKIRRTGLGPMVDGWVISEEADCLKPDPLIFEIAAQRCGIAPTGDWATHTWMVGDHAPADIAGAELAGLRSVWLHHGRPWAEPGYRPTLKAAGLPEAVGQVLAARGAPSPRPAVRAGATRSTGARRGAVASGALAGGALATGALATGTVAGRPVVHGVVASGVARGVVASGARGGAPVEPGPTAQIGAHHGVQSLPSAPDDGHAPSVAHTDADAPAAAAAGSAVRNRSGGFARQPDGHSGATPPPVPLPGRPSSPPAPDAPMPSPARAG